ncbi:hypothetical protein E6C60_3267 [Paenibacillus algicola]|uniref:Uncharacterized protein n=1 Tax=Paenibacillus algicola TaxID=2565926 RepID=A0A4P8XN40_9BACL|nr:hypothetical protein E6C60_3267 [Paenibacillus algicola]
MSIVNVLLLIPSKMIFNQARPLLAGLSLIPAGGRSVFFGITS